MSDRDRDRRTLPPTPKRREEFRRRGEVALSRDLGAALTMVGGAVGSLLYGDRSAQAVTEFGQRLFAEVGTMRELSPRLAERTATTLLVASLPAAGGALVGYLVAVGAQLGWPPALMPPRFDLSRLASGEALGALLSPRAALGRAAKSVAKVAFVAACAWFAARREVAHFGDSPAITPRALAARLAVAAGHLALWAGGALVALAVVDYVRLRFAHAAKLRMTPEEYKREAREQEGDPQIRRRRRQRMKELARRRLAVAVRGADVVLVNPTEYAVALRYRSRDDGAPRVVAKGRLAVAERIREIARAAGVPILPEPPLTRLLYKLVPEGSEIPAGLYQAVAAVLAHVYRLRERAR